MLLLLTDYIAVGGATISLSTVNTINNNINSKNCNTNRLIFTDLYAAFWLKSSPNSFTTVCGSVAVIKDIAVIRILIQKEGDNELVACCCVTGYCSCKLCC